MTFPCCGGDAAADRKIDIVRETQNAGMWPGMQRLMHALMQMKKIDIAALERSYMSNGIRK